MIETGFIKTQVCAAIRWLLRQDAANVFFMVVAGILLAFFVWTLM